VGFYADRIFPILLKQAVRRFEPDRDEMIRTAGGRVLEIGVGGGENLDRYTGAATEVVGIDFSPALLARARQSASAAKARRANLPRFSFHVGTAESLPFTDGAFDTVVAFLVFCSIPDPRAAVGEIYRVLRPGGKLVFFEHVRARSRRLARLQDAFNPVWTRLALGCNLNRDTRAVFEGCGFRFDWIEEFRHTESMPLTRPKIKGVAIRPD
jgi:ubiquinone/menaquinone biosynthesis C-methylase UbiE